MIITISRQVATNGELIGRIVAERLGLHYIDRELLNELARRMDVDPNVVSQFDETALNPVQSILWEWLSKISETTYLRALHQAFNHILKDGNALVVGRGGNLALHCPDCLHVRIIAPLALRVAIYRAEYGGSEQDAQRAIQQGDRERAHYIRNHFHEHIDDPGLYDLVLNLHRMTPEMAADVIVHAAQVRAQHQVGLETHATLPQHIEVMSRHRRPAKPPVAERENNRKIA